MADGFIESGRLADVARGAALEYLRALAAGEEKASLPGVDSRVRAAELLLANTVPPMSHIQVRSTYVDPPE